MTSVSSFEVFHKEGTPEEKKFYDGYYEAVEYLLKKLSAHQRTELFSEYCKFCGSDNPKCQCCNDE